MLTTGPGVHNGRGGKAWRLRLAISCLLAISAFLPHRGAGAQANGSPDRLDPAFARTMRTFLTAWLRRDLRDEENAALTRELATWVREKKVDAAGLREASSSVARLTAMLREHEGTSMGLRVRQTMLTSTSFDPESKDTASFKMLNEPDPIRFVDASTRRLMTERDVVALANLFVFARSDEGPRHRNLSSREAETLIVERLCDISKCGISEFFSEAAILWTGIQQQWPHLSAEERRAVRTYVQNGRISVLSTKVSSKLLGIDRHAAFNRMTRAMADTQIRAFEKSMSLAIWQRAIKSM